MDTLNLVRLLSERSPVRLWPGAHGAIPALTCEDAAPAQARPSGRGDADCSHDYSRPVPPSAEHMRHHHAFMAATLNAVLTAARCCDALDPCEACADAAEVVRAHRRLAS